MAGKSRADWNRRSVPLIIRFVSNVLWNWIHKHGRNSPISGVMPTFLNKIIGGESLLRLNSFADYRADAPRNSGCIWILGSHSCSKWDIEFDHQYFFLPFHGQLSFSLIHFICRNKVVVDNNYIYLVIKNYQIYMTLSIQYIYIYIYSAWYSIESCVCFDLIEIPTLTPMPFHFSFQSWASPLSSRHVAFQVFPLNRHLPRYSLFPAEILLTTPLLEIAYEIFRRSSPFSLIRARLTFFALLD